ncbi:MAG: multicopper oxidase domain-containing protein [Candidatus Thiodiazotropha sp. (ex Lucinoma borealis)]|nr:multicopper oxidase domain-containing protein [Candidatus Thiodiazotropha sp. (ex Lucinoma borealis)]
MEVNNRLIIGETAQSTPEQAMLMGPAERSDVIVDFRGLPDGTVVRMINTAPDAPFGGFPDVPADASTTGQVMQFVVNHALMGTSPSDEQRSPNGQLQNADTAATSPWDLMLGPVENNATPPANNIRDLVLIEEESALVCADVDVDGNVIQMPGEIPVNGGCPTATAVPFGPKAAVLGTTDNLGVDSVTLWSDPIVTTPDLDTTEIWNIKNITADAHPIHVHLVKYKVNGRTDLTGGPSPTVTTPNGMEAWESGWKDTVITYPGEITTIQAEFDIPGLYVWHCHIVEHEDNEMMVPFCVGGSEAQGGVCPDKLF